MANALYNKAKEKLLSADIDLTTSDIKIVLIDTAEYTVDLATDEFLDDIPALARISTSPNLSAKTITDGTFDSDDFSFTTVTGATIEAYVIYVDTGVEGTSALVGYVDTASGLPFTPNGNNVTFTTNPSGHLSI